MKTILTIKYAVIFSFSSRCNITFFTFTMDFENIMKLSLYNILSYNGSKECLWPTKSVPVNDSEITVKLHELLTKNSKEIVKKCEDSDSESGISTYFTSSPNFHDSDYLIEICSEGEHEEYLTGSEAELQFENSQDKNFVYKTRMCMYYAQSGYCVHGDNCKYAHTKTELKVCSI